MPCVLCWLSGIFVCVKYWYMYKCRNTLKGDAFIQGTHSPHILHDQSGLTKWHNNHTPIHNSFSVPSLHVLILQMIHYLQSGHWSLCKFFQTFIFPAKLSSYSWGTLVPGHMRYTISQPCSGAPECLFSWMCRKNLLKEGVQEASWAKQSKNGCAPKKETSTYPIHVVRRMTVGAGLNVDGLGNSELCQLSTTPKSLLMPHR